MRKLSLVFLVLVSAASAISAISARQIIGTWLHQDDSMRVEIRFSDDGTFSGSLELKKKETVSVSGSWSCSRNRIFYTYESPWRGLDEDQILSVSDEFLVIRAQDGAERRYNRARDKAPNQPPEPTRGNGT
jgi:hypothetical protein